MALQTEFEFTLPRGYVDGKEIFIKRNNAHGDGDG